ncbi:hypothetical protein [Nonomuraea ferruginea]|uniref:hypothetical protein n=1 Tax=Nonomuraea ferruginea TaxID=46174 RepID=UPI00361F812F
MDGQKLDGRSAHQLSEDGRLSLASLLGFSPAQQFFLPYRNMQQTACAVAGGNSLPASCPSLVHSA